MKWRDLLITLTVPARRAEAHRQHVEPDGVTREGEVSLAAIPLPVWLVAGAVVALVVKAIRTSGQHPMSRETVQDVFFGVVFAVAWGTPVPGMDAVWPPFSFSGMPGPQAMVLFAGLTYLLFDPAKAWVQKKAPEMFAKYTGQQNGKPEEKK